MRILIVEDDLAIAAAITDSLRQASHAVDHVTTGPEADIALHDDTHELLILDLGLPGLEGSEILRRLRQRGSGIPVLVITARGDLHERVRVLDLGADDYLIKPFALAEFEARLRALQRRSATRGMTEINIGRLRIDLPGRRAWHGEEALELTAREFGVLEALASRPERITSRAQLVEALCDWDQEITYNGLDIALHRLRRKLQGSGANVRTVRGLGYLLEESVDD